MLESTDAVVSLAIFSTAFILLHVLLRRRNGDRKSDKRRPPSLPALPLVGSLPFFRGELDDMHKFFLKTAETLGPVFHFYAGSKLAVVLNDRDSIWNAFVKHAEGFADRGDFWTESNVTNKDLKGIIFSHYHDTYKHFRKLTLSILKEFGLGTAKETEERTYDEIEAVLREINELNGRPFYPEPTISKVSADTVLKILFGKHSMSLINNREIRKSANDFVSSMDGNVDNAPIIRFLPKYRKHLAEMVKSQARLMDLLEKGIRHSRLEESDSSFVKRYLEEEGSCYDHENLLYVLRDLMLGSADTVATTLLWALVDLANHPLIQTRLQEEIDERIPADTRLPSLDDKPYLPYTEAVIMESMRRHTLVPIPVPHMTTRDTAVCGYFIPKGCLVIANFYGAHMNPKSWTDPEDFRPERFLDMENKVIGREKVITFSLGKRSCIGEILARQQIFLLLTSIVQQFHIRPPEGQSSISVREVRAITVRPSEFEIRLIPRRNS